MKREILFIGKQKEKDREECFAMEQGNCTILTDKFPTCRGCVFYKTQSQFEQDQSKALAKIKTLEKPTLINLRKGRTKYGLTKYEIKERYFKGAKGDVFL